MGILGRMMLTILVPLVLLFVPPPAAGGLGGGLGGAEDYAGYNEVLLRVRLLGDGLSRAPSCRHTYSQVELVNTHESDPLIIQSMETTPETTRRISPQGQHDKGENTASPSLPQQVHVSQFSRRVLTLQPGQVAIVPVTFLPRFPSPPIDEDNIDGNPKDLSSAASAAAQRHDLPPRPSAAAEADLADLVGHESLLRPPTTGTASHSSHRLHHQNYLRSTPSSGVASTHEHYQVKTDLIIDTSRGRLTVPLEATSLRGNGYGLPDVIRFRGGRDNSAAGGNDGGRIKEHVIYGTTSQQRTPTTPEASHSPTSEAEANGSGVTQGSFNNPLGTTYDLYITNPSRTEELRIQELFVSDPTRVSVSYDPDKIGSANTLFRLPAAAFLGQAAGGVGGNGLPAGGGNAENLQELGTAGAPPPIGGGGPVTVLPQGRDAYVATLRMVQPQGEEGALMMEKGGSLEHLGYLHLRTSLDELTVALEHVSVPIGTTDDRLLATSNEKPTQYNRPRLDSQSKAPNGIGSNSQDAANILVVDPSTVTFSVLTCRSSQSTATLTLTNNSPKPLRLMRVTVGIDVPPANLNSADTKHPSPPSVGLEIGVSIRDLNTNFTALEKPAADNEKFVLLPPGQTIENVVVLTSRSSRLPDCLGGYSNVPPSNPNAPAMIPKKGEKYPTQFTGTILIRATFDTNLSFGQWRDKMRNNPHGVDEVLVEIPAEASVMPGYIGFVLDGDEKENSGNKRRGGMNYDEGLAMYFPSSLPSGKDMTTRSVRPTNRFPVPLSLRNAVLLDEMNTTTAFENVPGRVVSVGVGGASKKTGTIVKDNYCSRRFEITAMRRGDVLNARVSRGEVAGGFLEAHELGLVSVRYRPVLEEEEEKKGRSYLPRTCYLAVTTAPIRTGYHRVPLVVYPNKLQVEGGGGSRTTSSSALKAGSPLGTVGDLEGWYHTTPEGSTLRSLLKHLYGTKKMRQRIQKLKKIGSIDNNASRNAAVKSGLGLLELYLHDLSNVTASNFTCKAKMAKRKKRQRTPLLLSLGSVGHTEVETASIHFTNHNPVPITVKVTVGAVEGLSIGLGQDSIGTAAGPTSAADGGAAASGTGGALDYLPRWTPRGGTEIPPASLEMGSRVVETNRRGRYGHPLPGLREFLLTNALSQNFFSTLGYRDAISLSKEAIKLNPGLEGLYRDKGAARFFGDPAPLDFADDDDDEYNDHGMIPNGDKKEKDEDGLWSPDPSWSTWSGASSHPMGYFLFESSSSSGRIRSAARWNGTNLVTTDDETAALFANVPMEPPGPILLSSDGAIAYPLSHPPRKYRAKNPEEIGLHPTLDRESVVLPPGGVARFDVKVRAPPKHVLPRDVTSFVGTGLVLETDAGQVIPLVVCYEALLGQLRAYTSLPTSGRGLEAKGSRQEDVVIDVPAALLLDDGSDDNVGGFTSVPLGRQQKAQKSDDGKDVATHGVPLYLTSTFSQDMVLREVTCCNRWFRVELNGGGNESTDGCKSDSGDVVFEGVLAAMSGQPALNATDDAERQNSKGCDGRIGDRKQRSITVQAYPAAGSAAGEASISDSKNGMKIGTLFSAITCPGSAGGSSASYPPSFYECALEWLSKKPSIQPDGCGIPLTPPLPEEGEEDDDDIDWAEGWDLATKNAVSALEGVVEYMGNRYGNVGGQEGGRGSGPQGAAPGNALEPPTGVALPTEEVNRGVQRFVDKHHLDAQMNAPAGGGNKDTIGTIPLSVVDKFDKFVGSWNIVSELGMNVVSGSLRAKADYYPDGDTDTDSGNGDKGNEGGNSRGQQSLTVSLPGLSVRTHLQVPQLFDRTGNPNPKHTSVPQKPASISDRGRAVIEYGRSILRFPPTNVAHVAALYVPVRNPSASIVRVGLVAGPAPSRLGGNRGAKGEDGYVNEGRRCKYSPVHVQPPRTHPSAAANVVVTSGPPPPPTGPTSGGTDPWWDGGGAYFLPDFQGRLLQSNHNVTIRSGGGAFVSLVNPSLQASSAFVLGCGSRCDLRNEGVPPPQMGGGNQNQPNVNNMNDQNGGDRDYSPIGAAAASGVTLVGWPSRSFNEDGNGHKKPALRHTPLGTRSPLPFALPRTALREVVLPPHGTSLLGPVYFRPPGRSHVDGDGDVDYFESILYLENSLTGLEPVVVQGRGTWERVVFLDSDNENDEEMDEEGGALEVRNGKVSLMFPGTASPSPPVYSKKKKKKQTKKLSKKTTGGSGTKVYPVLHGVMVHNEGDVEVDFAASYLTDASVVRFSNRKTNPRDFRQGGPAGAGKNNGDGGSCQERGFRLLKCKDIEGAEVGRTKMTVPPAANARRGSNVLMRFWRRLFGSTSSPATPHASDATASQDEPTSKQKKEPENIRHGFRLKPGQSKLLRIEHRPDCTFRTSYVMLHLEHRGRGRRGGDFRSGRDRGGSSSANRWDKSFQKSEETLLIGFDMTEEDLGRCRPVPPYRSPHSSPGRGLLFSFLSRTSWLLSHVGDDANSKSQVLQSKKFSDGWSRPLAFVVGAGVYLSRSLLALAAVLVLAIVAYALNEREQSFKSFRDALHGVDAESSDGHGALNGAGKLPPSQQPSVGENNWPAAFRCLARSDPTSSDLQALGREQTRQAVLERYKGPGLLIPQCLSGGSGGGFVRERSWTSSSSGGGGGAGGMKTGGVNRRGSMGSGSVVTLSDSIFRLLRDWDEEEGRGRVPCGLGWRAAAARGVIPGLQQSLSLPSGEGIKGGKSKVQELLLARGAQEKATEMAQAAEKKAAATAAAAAAAKAASSPEDSSDVATDGESPNKLATTTFTKVKNGGGSFVEDSKHGTLSVSNRSAGKVKPSNHEAAIARTSATAKSNARPRIDPPPAPPVTRVTNGLSPSDVRAAVLAPPQSMAVGTNRAATSVGKSQGKQEENAWGTSTTKRGRKKVAVAPEKQALPLNHRGWEAVPVGGAATKSSKKSTGGNAEKLAKNSVKTTGSAAAKAGKGGPSKSTPSTLRVDSVFSPTLSKTGSSGRGKGKKKQNQVSNLEAAATDNAAKARDTAAPVSGAWPRQQQLDKDPSSSMGVREGPKLRTVSSVEAALPSLSRKQKRQQKKAGSTGQDSKSSSTRVAGGRKAQPPPSPSSTVSGQSSGQLSVHSDGFLASIGPPLSPGTPSPSSGKSLLGAKTSGMTRDNSSLRSSSPPPPPLTETSSCGTDGWPTASPTMQKHPFPVDPSGDLLSTLLDNSGKSAIRPPPGLAPPPGFASGAAPGSTGAANQPTGSDSAPNLLQDRGSIGAQDDPLGVALATTSNSELSALAMPVYPQSALPSQPIGSAGQGTSVEPQVDASGEGLLATLLTEQDQPGVPSSTLEIGGTELPIGQNDAAEAPPSISDSPLLGLGDGFNVMNFLDGILDDSMQADDAKTGVDESGADRPGALYNAAVVPRLGGGGSGTGISSDPWTRAGGGTVSQSRAAAYGIAVGEPVGSAAIGGDKIEDAAESSGNLSLQALAVGADNDVGIGGVVLNSSIPLLTPESILGRVVSDNVSDLPLSGVDDDEKEKKDYFFSRDSFYESLLGE